MENNVEYLLLMREWTDSTARIPYLLDQTTSMADTGDEIRHNIASIIFEDNYNQAC